MNSNRKYKEMVGFKNGKLTVIEFAGVDHVQNAMWRCKCDCGGEITTLGNGLRRKRNSVQSCGCLQKDAARRMWKNRLLNLKRVTEDEWKLMELIHHYKLSGSSRGLEFTLTKDECVALSKQDCTYCGSEPANYITHKNKIWKLIYQGIDRVNSSIGYVKENCVACCKHCNRAKSAMSEEAFYDWLSKIYGFLKSKGKV